MNMQLKIIYHIRKNKEISLPDLCKIIFGSTNNMGSTVEYLFSNHLLDLYRNDFINIYKQSDKSNCFHTKKASRASEKYVQKIIFIAMSQITALGQYVPFDTMNTISSTDVFLSIGEKLNKVQELLGFSISYEIQKLKEDAQRNTIFGEINPDLANSKAFVIMPFEDDFKAIYEDHIKKVCDKLEYSCQRADLIDKPNVIINDIWSLINNAEIIVCDCTGRNPNVFYELGLAHALGKKVICITQNEEDIPFDIKQIRYIKYDYTPRGMEEFEKTLKRFMITDDISE